MCVCVRFPARTQMHAIYAVSPSLSLSPRRLHTTFMDLILPRHIDHYYGKEFWLRHGEVNVADFTVGLALPWMQSAKSVRGKVHSIKRMNACGNLRR